MKLFYFEKQKDLDDFVKKQSPCQFLQSWFWSEFQKANNQKVFLIGVKDGENILASALLILKKTFGFKYFYCPRGPIMSEMADGTAVLNFLFEKINELAKKERTIFLRFEPIFDFSPNNRTIKKTISIQPEQTLFLDLRLSKEELLKQMKQKTRYNIKLADGKGVAIEDGEKEDWPAVWKIFEQTKKRDKFSLHNKDYYEKMISIGDEAIKTIVAKNKSEIIAVGIFCFFGNTAVYLHGGSSDSKRNLMAPYLLQWRAINQAKEKSALYYDFYGIDENRWPGVTKFKSGFGGQKIRYPGSFDLIFNKVYYIIYEALRKLRRIC